MDESKKVNKVDVIVSGKVITFVATESEAYVRMLAKYIDEKITQIQVSKSKFSMSSIDDLILICINIADDMFKERQKVYNLDASLSEIKLLLDERESEIAKLKERTINTSKENQSLISKNNSLVQAIESSKEAAEQKIGHERKRLQNEIDLMKSSLVRETETVKTLTLELKALRNRLSSTELEKQELSSRHEAEKQKMYEKFEVEKHELKAGYEDERQTLCIEHESKIKLLSEEYENKIQSDKNELKRDLDEALERLSKAEAEKFALSNELESAKEKLSTAKKELNDFIDAFGGGQSDDKANNDNVVEFIKMS